MESKPTLLELSQKKEVLEKLNLIPEKVLYLQKRAKTYQWPEWINSDTFEL